jgi:hypothetical protein
MTKLKNETCLSLKVCEAYCKDYYEYYIPVSKKTYKTTKKFIKLLGMCKKCTNLKKAKCKKCTLEKEKYLY